MISISADSEVKEWREKNGELIQTVYLKRPSQEFLIKNGQTQEKVPSNNFMIKKKSNCQNFLSLRKRCFLVMRMD